jgi:anti-sigma factor ChrR (cupin superfamily)
LELNNDFSKRVVMHAPEIDWLASPMAGVNRRMLDRIGDEIARATTIVRYDPGSSFFAHIHDGGEEFIVLDGVFQDEHGDYPVGSYVRNPPLSSHTPGSEPGCTMLVKLWQFDLADREHMRLDMNDKAASIQHNHLGLSITPLFEDPRERVRLERWDPGVEVSVDTEGGAELFVIDGSFEESADIFQ